MVSLKYIMEAYKGGALNIKVSDDGTQAFIGGMQVAPEQAVIMCQNLGWVEWDVSPYEIIVKTKGILNGFCRGSLCDLICENAQIEFSNKPAKTYGKTFDRIHILMPRKFEVSVLCHMPGNSSAYTVFDSSTSAPIGKCKSYKQVAEFLNSQVM